MGVKRNPPVTEQVFSILLDRIRSGEYPSGDRLPAETELAQEFLVSRASIRTSMAKLEAAGLIERRHGDGTYVADRDPDSNTLIRAIWEFTRLIEESGRAPSIKGLSIEEREATAEEAGALGLVAGAAVIAVDRLFLADRKPIILSRNVMPASLFKKGDKEVDAALLTIHEFLRACCEVEIAYANAEISAVVADERVQKYLNTAPDWPLLLLEEVFYAEKGQPVVHAKNYYNDKSLSLHEIRPWH